MESRRIAVAGASGLRWADLTFSTGPPWRVHAVLDDGSSIEAERTDLFECLREVRRRLDRVGAVLCCEGARRDVFPSGMARQMAGGRKAYRLPRDPTAGSPYLVDIFAPTDCAEACSVDEQARAIRAALADRGGRAGGHGPGGAGG